MQTVKNFINAIIKIQILRLIFMTHHTNFSRKFMGTKIQEKIGELFNVYLHTLLE